MILKISSLSPLSLSPLSLSPSRFSSFPLSLPSLFFCCSSSLSSLSSFPSSSFSSSRSSFGSSSSLSSLSSSLSSFPSTFSSFPLSLHSQSFNLPLLSPLSYPSRSYHKNETKDGDISKERKERERERIKEERKWGSSWRRVERKIPKEMVTEKVRERGERMMKLFERRLLEREDFEKGEERREEEEEEEKEEREIKEAIENGRKCLIHGYDLLFSFQLNAPLSSSSSSSPSSISKKREPEDELLVLWAESVGLPSLFRFSLSSSSSSPSLLSLFDSFSSSSSSSLSSLSSRPLFGEQPIHYVPWIRKEKGYQRGWGVMTPHDIMDIFRNFAPPKEREEEERERERRRRREREYSLYVSTLADCVRALLGFLSLESEAGALAASMEILHETTTFPSPSLSSLPLSSPSLSPLSLLPPPSISKKQATSFLFSLSSLRPLFFGKQILPRSSNISFSDPERREREESDSLWEIDVELGGVVVGSGTGFSVQEAKNSASFQALLSFFSQNEPIKITQYISKLKKDVSFLSSEEKEEREGRERDVKTRMRLKETKKDICSFCEKELSVLWDGLDSFLLSSGEERGERERSQREEKREERENVVEESDVNCLDPFSIEWELVRASQFPSYLAAKSRHLSKLGILRAIGIEKREAIKIIHLYRYYRVLSLFYEALYEIEREREPSSVLSRDECKKVARECGCSHNYVLKMAFELRKMEKYEIIEHNLSDHIFFKIGETKRKVQRILIPSQERETMLKEKHLCPRQALSFWGWLLDCLSHEKS